MDFIALDVLSGELVPVLLGLSDEAITTAKRIFRRYKTVSHLFCSKQKLPRLLSLSYKRHEIDHSAGDTLMMQALRDFAGELGHKDLILYLIPCTPEYTSFVWNHREELECDFVIADEREMDRVWFGEQ